MRLRQPFNGYMLSSGHFMFHVAFLMGSYYAFYYVLDGKYHSEEEKSVLWQLNCAHILVPIFDLLSYILCKREWWVCSKVLNIISIFQY